MDYQRRRDTHPIVGVCEESMLRTTLEKMDKEDREEEAEMEAALEEAKRDEQKQKKSRHKEDQNDYENQIAIQNFFEKFDHDPTNYDGGVSGEDLYELLSELIEDISMEKCNKWHAEYDRDGNGVISMIEFIELMMNKLLITKDTKSEISEAFRIFDKDETGFITARDIRQIMVNFGDALDDEEFHTLMKKADIDGDGTVNYEEFIKIMYSNLFKEDGTIMFSPKTDEATGFINLGKVKN